MLEIIDKANKVVRFWEYRPLIAKLSKIQNNNEFNDALNKIKGKEKKELEEAVIGLTYCDTLSKEEQSFLNRYNDYCMQKSKNDIMEYLNNEYLKFLFINKSLEYHKDTNKKVILNGIKISDLQESLDKKYNEIIKKMDSEKLHSKEIDFIINFYEVCVNYYEIEYNDNDGLMSDLVKFFDKYSLDNLDLGMKRKMFILYSLSKELIKYPCNSIIRFVDYDSKQIRKLGYFVKINDNTGLINIYRTNSIFTESEEEFIEILFTIYHELGHFVQEFDSDEYTDEEKRIIKMEKKVIHNNRKFYSKYHDNFFCEIDADCFAIKMLEKNIHHEKLKSVISKEINRSNRIDQDTFIKLLLEEYDKCNQEELSK